MQASKCASCPTGKELRAAAWFRWCFSGRGGSESCSETDTQDLVSASIWVGKHSKTTESIIPALPRPPHRIRELFGLEKLSKRQEPHGAAHAPPLTLVVSSNEAQDVFVPQHDCLVNLCLPKPGPLVSGGEDFHSYILPTPFPTPDFAKSSFSHNFLQDNSPRDGSLDEQRQT